MTALGVYIDNSKQFVYDFEAWLGREVDFVHAVVGYGNWADYLNSAKWSISTLWNGLDRDIFWSVPIISREGNLGTAATGAYNEYYKQVAEVILAGTPGSDKIYVRTGWEANGSWFFWSAVGKEEAFKGAFRQFVETFREVSDRFIFEWNISQTSGGLDPASIYPGDDYVDIIGMDFYYKPEFHGYDPVKAFNFIRDDTYGLKWLEDFAAAHNKPTSYSEWGVQGDHSAEYVRLVKEWFDSHDVVLQSLWDSNAQYPGKLSDNSDPLTGDAYRENFSGPTVVELPGDISPPSSTAPTDSSVAKASGAWMFQTWGGTNWNGTAANDWHQSSGKGDDIMKGGLGDDTYVVMNLNDRIVEAAGEGTDTVSTWLASYTLPDHVENLTFTGNSWSNGIGNALANIIIGNNSNNVLNGKSGNDVLTGGGGKDTFVVAKGEGNDVITDFTAGQDLIRLEGFTFASFTALKAGAVQQGANTVLNLGDGQILTLKGFALADLTASAISTNYLPVYSGNSTTKPMASALWTAQSWGGANWVGSEGNDWHQSGGAGADVMKGGRGDDTYVISSATDKVVEAAGEGVDTVSTWIGSYTLPDNVENLSFFGHGWSNGTGNALANIITGNDGNNILNGKGGNDILTGGKGRDTFVIARGEGSDIITDFTAGEDILRFEDFSGINSFSALKAAGAQSGANTVFKLGNGQVLTLENVRLDALTADDVAFKPPIATPQPPPVTTSTATASGAWVTRSWGTGAKENWTGTDGNDWRQSNGGGDVMAGGLGDDTYIVFEVNDKVVELAGGGIDTVSTWIGNYTLPDHVENLTFTGTGWSNGTGNALANIITGNDSPNTLNGGGGNDILTGGKGNDTFVIAKGEGNDTITDFEARSAGSSSGDLLKLQGFGTGASLTNNGEVWEIRTADGTSQYVTLIGVMSLTSADYAFV